MSDADLPGVLISCQDVVDTNDHSGICVDSCRYTEVSYRGQAMGTSGRLARDVSITRSVPFRGLDWENVDAMDYI